MKTKDIYNMLHNLGNLAQSGGKYGRVQISHMTFIDSATCIFEYGLMEVSMSKIPHRIYSEFLKKELSGAQIRRTITCLKRGEFLKPYKEHYEDKYKVIFPKPR